MQASPLPGPPVPAYCIPMPGHDRATAQDPGVTAASPVMPASRSRLASRCQNVPQRTPALVQDSPARDGARRSRFRVVRRSPPAGHPRLLVGLGRFERPTSRLSGVRSNQLSYRPGFRGQRSDNGDRTRRGGFAPCRQQSVLRSLFSVLWKGCAGGGRGQGDTAGEPSLAAGSNGPAYAAELRSAALRKEVIQPQVPLRLPCYDFTPVADLTVDGCLLNPKIEVSSPASGQTNSHGVTGGVYKARERIHRGMLIHDY
jgi:hypothetical protein